MPCNDIKVGRVMVRIITCETTGALGKVVIFPHGRDETVVWERKDFSEKLSRGTGFFQLNQLIENDPKSLSVVPYMMPEDGKCPVPPPVLKRIKPLCDLVPGENIPLMDAGAYYAMLRQAAKDAFAVEMLLWQQAEEEKKAKEAREWQEAEMDLVAAKKAQEAEVRAKAARPGSQTGSHHGARQAPLDGHHQRHAG